MMAWDRLLPLGRHGDAARVRPADGASNRPGDALVTPDRTPFQRDYDRITSAGRAKLLHFRKLLPYPDGSEWFYPHQLLLRGELLTRE